MGSKIEKEYLNSILQVIGFLIFLLALIIFQF